MYQSPPSVPVWTWRQWIAVIGAGALGAVISLGLISLARGDIGWGLRGSAMGAFQCLAGIWRNLRIRPNRPTNAKNQRAVMIIASVLVLLAAGKISLDLIQGRPMAPVISTVLGAMGPIIGPLWIWGRHHERVQRAAQGGS